jgi:hypothetical protein
MGKSQYDRDAFLLKGPRLPQLAIESLELQNRSVNLLEVAGLKVRFRPNLKKKISWAIFF